MSSSIEHSRPMTRILIAVAVLLLPLLAVLPAGAQAPQAPETSMRMEVETQSTVAGVLPGAEAPVRFEVRSAEPSQYVYQLRVGGLAVDAVYDFAARSILLDGHEGTIRKNQILALQELTRQIELRLESKRQNVDPRWDMLHRLANYLAAAPAGIEIGALRIDAPKEVGVELPIGAALLELEGEIGTAACQVDSDDGIVYLAGGCGYYYYNSYHDASSHCWANTPTYAGCSASSDCLGRCGAGCGSGGAGSYTTDCKDHDRCCRIHGGCTNPFATDCGDEYFDAADDFTFGGRNCSGCF